MKARCLNVKTRQYHDYGGRGITVCDEWITSFSNFHQWAIKNGYRQGLTIERKDNDKGYSPDNCKWADRKEQNNHKRNNILLTCNGETKTLQQWCDQLGISRGSMRDRLKHGWPVEDAVTIPALKGRRNQFAI